jgi:hypothetical protein
LPSSLFGTDGIDGRREKRAHTFGSVGPDAIAPGERTNVSGLYQQNAASIHPRSRACYVIAMRGRFMRHLSWEELQRLADLIGQPRNLAPRYNIAPTTQIGEIGVRLVEDS